MRKINTALIGYGMAGKVFHAPIITSVPELHLKKVVERKSALSKERYPWVEIVKDAQEVFEADDIELVVIAAPNTEHYGLAKRALSAGKHVVVEKPFTVTSEEALELAETADKKGLILSVHHNRRWDSDFLTIKKIIENGMLGEILEYEAHYDRYRKNVKANSWREADIPGSGFLYDLGSHLIDQALQLFGYPEYVTGFMRTQREGGAVEDNFEVVLEYEKGPAVVIRSSMMMRIPLPRYMINGASGSFMKYGVDTQEEALKAGLTPETDNSWGKEPQELWGEIYSEKDGVTVRGRVESIPGDYRLYYKDVAQAIINNRKPSVTALDGAAVIKVIELAKKSFEERQSLKFKL